METIANRESQVGQISGAGWRHAKCRVWICDLTSHGYVLNVSISAAG